MMWRTLIFIAMKVILFWIFGSLPLALAGDESRPVFIMLIGTSGSGKSEILSTLLNENQALSVELSTIHSALDETQSPEIVEYRLNGSSTELRVITIADFQDTHRLETDARLIATLEDYLDTHEHLNSRAPDLLVICKTIDGNGDEDSKFNKMLRSLSTMSGRLFEFSNPEFDNKIEETPDVDNVLFALTQNQMSNRRTVRRKTRETRSAVTEYMKVPSENIPMVIVQGQDQTHADFCREMNNLILNKRFDFKNAVCSRSIVQLLSNISLVEITHPKAAKQLRILISMNKNANETEVSSKLEIACNRISCSNSAKSELKRLQEYLHDQRIFNVSDLPQTDIEISSLFRGLQNASIDVLRLLNAAFELKPVKWEPMIGHGYSLVLDNIFPANPFHFEQGDSVSCIGSILPRGVECRKRTGLNQVMKYLSSTQDYVVERALALAVPKKYLKINHLENRKPGYTFPDSPWKSVYVEFLTFEVSVSQVGLSHEFLAVINSLPKFNTSSRESISAFERLFKLYGTQIVSKLNYGGAIEFLLSDSWDLSTENPLKEIDEISTNKALKSKDSSQIRIYGGDSNFYSTDAADFLSESRAKSLFSKWRESIINQPIPLTHTPVAFTPLTTILKTNGINQDRIQDVEAAINYVNGDNFEIDGTERKLKILIQTCSVELDESSQKVTDCESAAEKSQTNCSAQREKCEELNSQHTALWTEKINLISELNTVKAAVLEKEVDNSGLRLQNSETEGRMATLEASIQFTREELRAQEGHSVKLAKLLESFG